MRKILALLMIITLPTLLVAQENQVLQNRPIVFRNVTIIDMRSEQPKPNLTIVVSGNRISKIGRNIKVPKDAEIIDTGGKYLIPGLWDMHVHSLTDNRYEWVFPLLVANGVTGVREMGSNIPYQQTNQIRREILEGKLLGPRLDVATAKIFDGPGTALTTNVMVVSTAEQARSFVKDYKQQGIDFIKPYNFLSREVYLAIVDEAKRQKIAVSGHVPYSMTAAEVSDSRQISIEHNNDILLSISRDEGALRKELQDLPKNLPFTARQPIQAKAAATIDERKAAALFERFARNGTWLCPTTIGLSEETQNPNDPRLKYIPASMKDRWRNQLKLRNQFMPNQEAINTFFQKRLEIVGLMHRAGVRLLAGSDTVNAYIYPGSSLHEELELFVQTGLSPFEALQTATVNPAKFMRREKDLGTIETGKLADLILLDANPLENISNTRKINAVVINGRLLKRKNLDELFAQVEIRVKN